MTESRPRETSPLLEIRDLSVSYRGRDDGRPRRVLDEVSLEIGRGEIFGLVGESGSGKSTLANSIVRLLPEGVEVSGGPMRFDGADVMGMTERALRNYRATEISFVHQNPTAALDPSMTIRRQLEETVAIQRGLGRRLDRDAVLDGLREVSFPDPRVILGRYPHQLSGGQQQRVCIAMALLSRPKLLVLDEPTSGLDVSVQSDILRLLYRMRRQHDLSMLYISHDLSTVRKLTSRVGILYEGRLVEQNDTEQIFLRPQHPYTRALLACIPDAGAHKSTVRLKTISSQGTPVETTTVPQIAPASDERILEAHEIGKRFGRTVAVRGVDLFLRRGEVLGIVGESGSGKSTLARLLTGLSTPDSGSVHLDGERLAPQVAKRTLAQRRMMQMVFQRPDTTLNPVLTVSRTLSRSVARLRGNRSPAQLLEEVRLGVECLAQLPGQLSGGMRQRVAIARALAGDAEILICDEATSALDPSIQASILNQIVDLSRERQTAIVFISHDLDAVRYVSDRVMVMYQGEVVERGEVEAVLDAPQHEYTRRLIASSSASVA